MSLVKPFHTLILSKLIRKYGERGAKPVYFMDLLLVPGVFEG